MKKILTLVTSALLILTANSQNIAATHSNSPRVKLYIDCSQANCDFNYIRQEIPVTDFVIDRKESDVHILISVHSSASGGQKYDILFFGQNKWAEKNDSLYFFTLPNSSQDNIRKQLVKVIQAGIAPYLTRAGQIDNVNFSFVRDTTGHNSSANIDKWNNWVFSVGGTAELSGDKNYRERNLSVNSSAGKVTESSKLQFYFYNRASKNLYTIEDGGQKSTLKTTNHYLEVEQNYVKSISSKWSWAVQSSYRKSSYDNLRNSFSTAAGFEYNIYPYKLSSSKFFALRAMLEGTKRDYMEETIYSKLGETLFSTNLGAYIYFTQPWGSISSSITWYNYLHDFSKNNLSMYANLGLKLFKGVSINLYGTASLINDQSSLAGGGATSQEVLLKLKALATTFNYYTGIGINYKFGSKFNNFVNPRFTSGRF